MRLAFLPIAFVKSFASPAFPGSFAVLQAVIPLTFITFSVRPEISSPSFRLAINVCPFVSGFILEDLKADSMLAIIFELAFINTVGVVKNNALK
jgi:hypothetical protein